MTDTKRVTAADSATESIRKLILSGQLSAGETIREDELAERLGISRTPLREAIARLEAQGFLRSEPYRGVSVYKPSAAELMELYQIREALEGLASKLAAERATDADLEPLEELIAEMDASPPVRTWVALNREFHLGVYRLAGLPRLLDMIANLRAQSELYIRILVSGGHTHEAQEGHRRILAALRRNDPVEAERATLDHMENTVRHVLAELEEEEL